MNRKLDRSYYFNAREVAEIVIAHLRAKDIPAPGYVGDTPTCKWVIDDQGIRVTWTDEDQVELT